MTPQNTNDISIIFYNQKLAILPLWRHLQPPWPKTVSRNHHYSSVYLYNVYIYIEMNLNLKAIKFTKTTKSYNCFGWKDQFTKNKLHTTRNYCSVYWLYTWYCCELCIVVKYLLNITHNLKIYDQLLDSKRWSNCILWMIILMQSVKYRIHIAHG